MAFDWKKFIKIADELIKNKNEESYRSVVNRAYYAAYNQSKTFIEVWIIKGDLIVPEREGRHSYIIRSLKGVPEPYIRQAGRDLGDLFDDRKEADYEKDVCIEKRTATLNIERAKKIIKQLDKGYIPLR